MKKIVALLLFSSLFFSAKSQEIDPARAIQLVTKNLPESGLTYESLVNSAVVNAYHNRTAGTDMVYLQQVHKGLPVFNQIHVLAFKQDKLVSQAGDRIWEIKQLSNDASELPSLDAAAAVRAALASKKLVNEKPLIGSPLPGKNKVDFGKPGRFSENITAELLWTPIHEGTAVRLAWQVYIVPTTTSDYWLIRVDARTGEILGENNLTVYCHVHGKPEKAGTAHKTDNNADNHKDALQSNSNNANGVPRLFNFSASGPLSPNIINNATYRVIPFPAESPKHPGGTPSLVSNPWLQAPGNATSLGWHSNGTTDYTFTRGNNVWAKEDWAANNSTSGQPAASTTTTEPLNFDFPPNFNAPPQQTTPSPNLFFNITNLFYWNNIIHDILYLYGMDEVAGNFQANNQGRGGAGNDFVFADAQDGNFVAPNQNNANFSTPPDGGSGRMQMYLWNATPNFTVNNPTAIAGPYTSVESNFSTANKLINVGPVTGDVVYYNDNAAGTTHEACVPPANTLTGKIALIDRGNCEFVLKVKNAQNAGAIGVVMINNVAGSPITMGGTDNTITIPAVMISDTDGALFRAQLGNGLNVTMAAGQNMDGDVDNGIIVHEFGHGISNRLTGGPAQATCVSNAEQMGEGWSDYYALMLTQDWANSNVNTGFTNPRGIGTYAIGQTPAGLGIRTKKYCTDFTVNDLVFAASISAQQHERGELWCATLWDMTWNIIKQTNSIAPSIYQSNSLAGNVVALKLVTEAMKLQPCNPGFIDGRNAILRADSILYNGQFNCAIREAFRRRGMGLRASQGSANNVNDQTPDFTPYVTMTVRESATQVPEGQNITFTTQVTSCSPFTGYVLRDTLPSNVTYVSGGTYDAVNRVVSFTVDFTSGGTQSYSFTVQANPGSYFTPQTYFEEQVATNSLPAGWTQSSTTGNTWIISNTQSSSSPFSLFSPNAAVASDQRLETTASTSLGTGQSSFSFSHRFNTQAGFDGGVVEVSTDNGTTWSDLNQRIVAGYYNGSLATGSGNPIANRQAWTGVINTFIRSSVNMSGFAGQNVKLRFRFGSNNSTAGTGWYVDDIILKREAAINIRSSLFNGATRVTYSDTVAIITQAPSCTNVAITAQPANSNACTGTNVSFTVTADGTSPAYQWQVSTDGGSTWGNISGATGATLTLSSVTLAQNNNRYRVLVSNGCPSNTTSTAAILTVADPANISSQPADAVVCENSSASFSVAATGSSNTYQWQVSTDGGNTWTNITGATNATLAISGVTASLSGNRYRVVIQSCGPAALNSASALLTVNSAAAISSQPVNTSACTGGNAVISVTSTGTSVSHQWQVSTDGGNTWTNIAGATTATLTLSPVTSSMNNNRYRVIVSNSCNPGTTSSSVTLTVSDPASISSQPTPVTICEGGNASFSVTASGTSISYQWQVSTDGGTTWTNVAGATSPTLNLNAVPASFNGNRYRAVLVSCSPAGLNSDAALLTVNAGASFTTQPANTAACVGNNATFTVTAAGPGVSYQWQLSTDGGNSFTDVTGANAASLTLNSVTISQNGHIYRVRISNSCTASLLSSNATLTVSNNASIQSQPANSTVCEGSNTSFSATATGLSFQWQVSTDGGNTWTDVAGATGTTLNLNSVTSSMSGNRYRLQATGCSAGPALSAAAILTVNSNASIATQPAGLTVCEGNNASFSITVNGTSPAIQWQVSTDGGNTWTDITGANASTLNLGTVNISFNGNRYRAVISNICTANLNSDAALLTVTSQPVINSQPAAASGCPGSSVNFSVGATGPGLSYQWQVSTDGGASWSNINGATGVTLTLSGISSSMNNNRYRAVILSSCSSTGINSSEALLTVLGGAQITQQPASVSACAGGTAVFNVTASGASFNYQWQVSTDGGNSYTDLAGETNASLSISNVTAAQNNNRYRVRIIANPCDANSEAAILTVSPAPVVTISASPYQNLYPGLFTTLTASSNPQGNTFAWFKNGIQVPGASGSTLRIGFADRGIYTASNLDGCGNLSGQFVVGDSASSLIFIYPNPSNGQFQVRYFDGSTQVQAYTITIYDEKGSRVYSKAYTVGTAFEDMRVDIRNLSQGLYLVCLNDRQGKRIGVGKVIKK